MGNPIVRRPPNTINTPNKFQTKFLPSNTSTNGTISSLTFNNLAIGKTYHLMGIVIAALDQAAGNDDALSVTITNGATTLTVCAPTLGAPDAQGDQLPFPVNVKFVATATTITFTGADLAASSFIIGSGTGSGTYMTLEECNDLVTTTDFT